jgi:hypothetical protein
VHAFNSQLESSNKVRLVMGSKQSNIFRGDKWKNTLAVSRSMCQTRNKRWELYMWRQNTNVGHLMCPGKEKGKTKDRKDLFTCETSKHL